MSLRANWILLGIPKKPQEGYAFPSPELSGAGPGQAGEVRAGRGLLLTAVAFSITAEIGVIFVRLALVEIRVIGN